MEMRNIRRRARGRVRLIGGLVSALTAAALPAPAQTLEIRWTTIDGGGATALSGGVLTVGGTAGQPDAGAVMSGGLLAVRGGYWVSSSTTPSADLGLVKTDSADPVFPGATFSYQLAVGNAGPGPASSLVVTDTLPAGVGLVSVSGSNWSCSASGGVVTCTRPALSPGAAPPITVTVTAPGSAASLLNTASVTSATPDASPGNNADDEATTVLAAADLSISNWAEPGPVPPTEPVSSTVTVTNAGPDTATSIVVEDLLPDDATFQSASGSGWTCGEAGGTVTCTLTSLASGAVSDPITVVVVPPSTSTHMTSWAWVESAAHDPATGDNSDSATTEIDADPPRVTLVASAADTGDGRLAVGEITRAALTQLITVFSEEVADPEGDSDPEDVTNPANYLVVAAGGDGSVATSSCASGVAPSDLQAPIQEVVYDPATRTAFARLAGAASLPMDRYRLLVCGSTSIVDAVGLALDGNGDGSGGDDHVVDFAVGASNLLLNPNFDSDLEHWTAASAIPGEIDPVQLDADGVPTSGAAGIVNLSGPGAEHTLRQCVPATAGQFYRLAGLRRVTCATPGAPAVSTVVDFFSGPGCSGAVTASIVTSSAVGDTGGSWRPDLGGLAQAPIGSESARVWLVVEAGPADELTVDLDNLSFFDSGFFADDFESGGTTAWSVTSGGTP